MIVFPAALVLVGLLFSWQLVHAVSRVREKRGRGMMGVRLLGLIAVAAFVVFGWRAALFQEMRFLEALPPYPGATIDLFRTPIFSGDPYWTYRADASADAIFTWYRSRAKHAGWRIDDPGSGEPRVFMIALGPRDPMFVVLDEENGRTVVTYTREGALLKVPEGF